MYKTNGQYEDFIDTSYTYGVNDISYQSIIEFLRWNWQLGR